VVRAVYLCRPRRCEDFSYATIDWAFFHENQAGVGGGAIACVSYASPSFTFAHIWANRTDGNGGGVYCGDFASPHFHLSNMFNCVAAGHGGALYSETGAAPIVEECMLVFSMHGEGAYAADDASIPYFHCCDIYGNQDGDWVGRIAAQGSVENNFSLNPLPCDSTDVLVDAPLYVETCSPCFRGNDPSGSCGDVGNVYTGCECGEAAKPTEWGAIKSLYR
jgi:predicted outer membrane repeat protein